MSLMNISAIGAGIPVVVHVGISSDPAVNQSPRHVSYRGPNLNASGR